MERSDLNTNKFDITVSIGKSAAGLVPFFGGAIGEIVGNIIPNQRIDRIVRFLEKLDNKVTEIEKEQFRAKLITPEFVDIMEDAFLQAARALTDERTEYISQLIKNGLTDEQLDAIAVKRILWLLGELNDLEVIILKSYDRDQIESHEFFDKHKDAIMGPHVFIGCPSEDVDKHSVHETHKKRLEELGLLTPSFKSIRKGELPEFDGKTGMIKASGYSITNLGNLLLRYIGLSQHR